MFFFFLLSSSIAPVRTSISREISSILLLIENEKYLSSLSNGIVEERDEALLIGKGLGSREVAVQVVPDTTYVLQGEPVPGGPEPPEAGDGGIEHDAHEIRGGQVDGGGWGAAVVPEHLFLWGAVEGGHEDVDVVVAAENVVVGRE